MDIKENAAYLKGLFDGYDIDKNTKEAKLMGQMLDLMMKMSERIDELEGLYDDLHEYVEELDHDLGAVEEDLYFTDEDEEYDEEFEEEFENDFDDDSGYDEFVCPSCGETICVDESVELAEVICPACGEMLGDIELCDGNCEGCSEDCDSADAE